MYMQNIFKIKQGRDISPLLQKCVALEYYVTLYRRVYYVIHGLNNLRPHFLHHVLPLYEIYMAVVPKPIASV